MRKVTINLKVKKDLLKIMNFLLEKTETIELLELIKLDFNQGYKMGIAALTMREGYSIEDVKIPEYMEMLTVLKQEGNRYVVLSKVNFFKNFSQLAKKFDIDIVWETPSVFTKNELTLSVLGNQENLKKFIELIKSIGEINSISFTKAVYNEYSILSCLTSKQKEILIAAKKNGYYDYPRNINSQQLSEKIGLSKPTVIEHLRKAEGRIVSQILAGY